MCAITGPGRSANDSSSKQARLIHNVKLTVNSGDFRIISFFGILNKRGL
jgi:hypothetical protein